MPTNRNPADAFQCSSASRKFLNVGGSSDYATITMFQCSSASRKFLNSSWSAASSTNCGVSVLFSEPKIPQCSSIKITPDAVLTFQCSSASRKFLNEDVEPDRRYPRPVSVLFSEPKIPQYPGDAEPYVAMVSFSALQRAENSSIHPRYKSRPSLPTCFSALQRAENSSIL